MLPVEAGLYILPDEELSVVDCVIDSDNGRIDAKCKSQIYEIKERLSEWLRPIMNLDKLLEEIHVTDSFKNTGESRELLA